MPAARGDLWDNFLNYGQQLRPEGDLWFTVIYFRPTTAASSVPIQSDSNRGRELNQVLNQFKLCNHSEPGSEPPRMHHCMSQVQMMAAAASMGLGGLANSGAQDLQLGSDG